MKKVFILISIVLVLIILLPSCVSNSKNNYDEIVLNSKIYENDNTSLTKYDVAIWLVNISNCVKGNTDDLLDYSDNNRNVLFKKAIQSDII